MRVGFVGLGNMGSALAENIATWGFDLVVHDVIGPARAPADSTFVDELAAVASDAEVVVLSLPDGTVARQVAEELAAPTDSTVRHVVDTSTVGVDASKEIGELLALLGVGYVDAPVSGGPAGARARTLTVMYAAADATCDAVGPVLAALSDRRFRVGNRPGMAQAVKLANNFLAATALAATSEAVRFAQSVEVDPGVLLEVLAVSSGSNIAVADKFPNHVLTGTYASGFTNTLMAKDLKLFVECVARGDEPGEIGALIESIWRRFVDADPGADFTRIFPFIAGNRA